MIFLVMLLLFNITTDYPCPACAPFLINSIENPDPIPTV